MSERSKFLLDDKQIPTVWVNVLPSLPEPLAPPLHPGTRAPLRPEDLQPLFPMELIEQEFSPKPLIDIPGEVMDIYRLWRATPLYRARRLEKALDTPAHIYYKYEGTSPAGSHKPNTAVAQAYYNKQAGIRRLATETGAGQWGSALALARTAGVERLDAQLLLGHVLGRPRAWLTPIASSVCAEAFRYSTVPRESTIATLMASASSSDAASAGGARERASSAIWRLRPERDQGFLAGGVSAGPRGGVAIECCST